MLSERNSPNIIGYYTLSATSIAPVSLPPELARKYGRYGVLPATLLGRLAVDVRHRGKGMGVLLLYNAVRRTLRSGIASMAVVVDAIDENAVAFYERYGFRRFEDDPTRLYLPMSSIRDIFPGDEGSSVDRLEQRG